MAQKEGLQIEKLRGLENYHTWCFAVKNALEYRNLEKCITEPVTETDTDKLQKCKSILCLCVETKLYVHIMDATSASQVWKKFKELYEDKGMTRKIGLLRNLIGTKLSDCDNMQGYVNTLLDYFNKINAIDFKITDDWKTAILLSGLTDDFKPFIMSIEASETSLKAEQIMSKLLDSESASGEKGDAFFANKKTFKNSKKKFVKRHCDKCNSNKHDTDWCGKNKKKEKTEYANNAFALFSESKEEPWYVDSGTSQHMTPDPDLLENKQKVQVPDIRAANGGMLKIDLVGKKTLDFGEQSINANEIFYVPGLSANLLSVSKICSHGNTVLFDNSGCTVRNSKGQILAQCKEQNGVYKLYPRTNAVSMLAKTDETALMWHRRLGHINYAALKKMRDGIVDGIKFNDDDSDVKRCEACCVGKQARLPFAKSETKTKQILELIHTDVMGPMQTQSIGHAKYVLTFIDDYSKKVFVYFMKQKSEVFDIFVKFKNFIENQTDSKIKIIRSDNGGEFCSRKFDDLFTKSGIQHQLTAPYTPQQNGTAERMNRTLVEKAKCMLYDADLPNTFWAEAVNMAAYLVNRSACSAHSKTPDELFFGKKIDVSNIKIFGSPVMVHINKENRRKLDPKAAKMVFVGYDSDTKGFRCVDRQTRKIVISRDVKFFEHNAKTFNNTIMDDDEPSEPNNVSSTAPTPTINVSSNNGATINAPSVSPNEPEYDASLFDDDDNGAAGGIITLDDTQLDESDDLPSPPSNANDPDFSTRANLNDAQRSPVSTRNRLKQNQVSLSEINSMFFAMIAEPVTFDQAVSSAESKQWRDAMDDEMKSHALNKTWSLEKLPADRKAIKCKWVFKVKRDVNGDVEKFKARMCGKGYSQREGIDYQETFAPVVRYTSLRYLIGLAVKDGYKICQMDAITAFLQGDLTESVYMEQPEGYNDGSGRVCKLQKAIYGLKQAGHEWNKKLDRALLEVGMIKSRSDPCIYYTKNKNIILAIYVDDFLIFYRSTNNLGILKQYLNRRFMMKDLGTAQRCLGMRITQHENGIAIDQSMYIIDILKRFNMFDCNPVGTPTNTALHLSVKMVNENNEITGKVPYQEAVGSLLHLSQATRPDIAYAVHDVSRFNSKHANEHWQAVKRIFRYLKGTINYKLNFCRTEDNMEMHAFSDADWGSEVDERHSCSGHVVLLSNAAVSWYSHRQEIVAMSSTEAEYIALWETGREVIWLRNLEKELVQQQNATIVHMDNTSSMKLAESDAYRRRSKHIDIRYHKVRELIKLGFIKLKYRESSKMVADSLTKAVTKEKTQYCAREFGLVE